MQGECDKALSAVNENGVVAVLRHISEFHSGEFDFTSYLTMCQVGDGVRPLNLFRTRPRGREEGGREGRGVSAYESGYSAHSTHPIVKLRRATEQLRFFARKTHAG